MMLRTKSGSTGSARDRTFVVGCSPWGLSALRKHVIPAAVFAVVVAGCSSDASPATTTPPTTSVSATAEVASPSTTAEVAPPTLPSTTVASTVPDTTEPAPTTTTVEDQLLKAINRAQKAMRNCYAAAPSCDQRELKKALVGVQLDGILQQASEATYQNVDALTWTILDGPTLEGDELAVATVCAFDPMVVTYPDGAVNDGTAYFRQEWQLLPVGKTWRVSEVINQTEPAQDASVCDA